MAYMKRQMNLFPGGLAIKRHGLKLSLFLILIGIGFIYMTMTLIHIKVMTGHIHADEDDNWIVAVVAPSNKIKQYPACPIPQLDPYDNVFEQLANQTSPPLIDCEAKFQLLFSSTLNSTIIPVKGPEYFRKLGWVSCCYRTVERDTSSSRPDNHEILSSVCFPLSIEKPTKFADAHEFIAIFCRNGSGEVPVDVLAFVPLKSKGAEEEDNEEEAMTGGELNVVIFGIDATSRMNLLRTMPQSYSFLKNEMGAVEMTGYNKVGENTFPNLIPLLTSQADSELRCSWHVDDCPLIWKQFSNAGYYTSYNEDSKLNSLFQMYTFGFKSQPTDYYLRPLARWTGDNLVSEGCYGPRPSFRFLLDYMHNFMERMSQSKKNFFQFTWATELTHEHPRSGKLGDVPLLQSLKRLKGSGHLDNTVFILMSDHGARMGGYRNTIQGQLEDRLPFMLLYFPDSFKQKYARAYQNILGNQDKLMTVFDLHETLLDILYLDGVQETRLRTREREITVTENNSSLPRGLSLFLPIPESRTCKMAGIEKTFCSCNYMRPVPLSRFIDVMADAAVSHINSLLKDHPQCAHLRLNNVTLAQHVGYPEGSFEAYLINFVTTPGKAEFEGMLERKDKGNWTVQWNIVRTNRYGDQSQCVQDRKLKPFCYCSD